MGGDLIIKFKLDNIYCNVKFYRWKMFAVFFLREPIFADRWWFGESSNSNKTVTQLNAMTERRSLKPLPMMPSIRVTTL